MLPWSTLILPLITCAGWEGKITISHTPLSLSPQIQDGC